MGHDPFEALRARLEEQLRADIELLHEAHRIKLRAFETVWRVQAELGQTTTPNLKESPEERPALAPPSTGVTDQAPRRAPQRNEGWTVFFALQEKMDELPEVFDKNDVARVLGFTPKRATLFRTLDELRKEGWIANERPSEGRHPARFRRLARPETESA
jgi:hypothetical protein